MISIVSPQKTNPSNLYSLAFSDIGEEGKGILLLHGLFDSKATWNWLIPHLDSHRLILPDLLGHGESSKFFFSKTTHQTGLTPDLQSDCLKDLIVRLKLENFILGGSSYGGGIALNTYLRHPEIRDRIKGIVIIAAAGHSRSIPPYVRRMGGWLGKILQKQPIFRLCHKTGLLKRGVRRSVNRNFYDSRSIPDGLVDNIVKELSDIKLIQGYHLATRSLIDFDVEIVRKKLSSVACPTLIIWGRQDQIIPAESAISFANELPNAKIEWLDSCGHAPHIEKAKQTSEYIKKFALDCEKNKN